MKKTYYEYFINNVNKNYLFDIFNEIKKNENINRVIDIGTFIELFPKNIIDKIIPIPILNYEWMSTILYFVYYTWRDKNFFEISSELIDNLNSTDINNIDSYFINAPYRSMYIQLQCPIYFESYSFSEVFLTFTKYNKLTTFKNAPENSYKFLKCIYVLIAADTIKPNAFRFLFTFADGKLIDDINYWKNNGSSEMDLQFGVKLITLICKILLYINTINCNIINFNIENVKDKLNDKNFTKKQKKKIINKLNYKINDYNLIDIPITLKDKYNNIKYEKTGLFKNPIKVRGHFRNQACGKKYSERKIKWIEPYIKGDIKKDFDKRRNYKVY